MSKKSANVKTCSNKSNARRALNSIGSAALHAAAELLTELADGRWSFDIDRAEQIQNDADEAVANGESKPVAHKPAPLVKPAEPKSAAPAKVEPVKAAPVKTEPKVESKKFDPLHPNCPKCGTEYDQTWATEGVSCFCHHCSTTYSITTGRVIPQAGKTRPNASKGYTIQKEREEKNGVKRPSEGTICGAVWSAFDAIVTQRGEVVSADIPVLATANNWNKNNVSCEFYAWRKFNGISGRKA